MAEESKNSSFTPELDEMIQEYILAAEGSRAKEKLRGQIVGQVMPYVKKIAHGLARRSTDPLEDLIQVGNIGLMKALDKYNPLAGTSFKTYATYLITGEIRHYLRDKTNMIKAPRQMYELYYRVNQIVQKLTEELGRTPTDLEIAEELQCPVNKVTQAQETERRRRLISLDQFMTSEADNETVYVERLVDDKSVEVLQNQENKLVLDQAISGLKDELKEVVYLTFFEDLSQNEIAKRLGISQMQVSRRLRKALDQLSETLKPELSESRKQ